MTQPDTRSATARVSVFDAGTRCEKPGPEPDLGGTTDSVQFEEEDLSVTGAVLVNRQPLTRGPYDVWHSEEYLLGWLCRTHGWRAIEPGLLRRCTSTDAAPASLEVG